MPNATRIVFALASMGTMAIASPFELQITDLQRSLSRLGGNFSVTVIRKEPSPVRPTGRAANEWELTESREKFAGTFVIAGKLGRVEYRNIFEPTQITEIWDGERTVILKSPGSAGTWQIEGQAGASSNVEFQAALGVKSKKFDESAGSLGAQPCPFPELSSLVTAVRFGPRMYRLQENGTEYIFELVPGFGCLGTVTATKKSGSKRETFEWKYSRFRTVPDQPVPFVPTRIEYRTTISQEGQVLADTQRIIDLTNIKAKLPVDANAFLIPDGNTVSQTDGERIGSLLPPEKKSVAVDDESNSQEAGDEMPLPLTTIASLFAVVVGGGLWGWKLSSRR